VLSTLELVFFFWIRFDYCLDISENYIYSIYFIILDLWSIFIVYDLVFLFVWKSDYFGGNLENRVKKR
jgi:hypothetical protein